MGWTEAMVYSMHVYGSFKTLSYMLNSQKVLPDKIRTIARLIKGKEPGECEYTSMAENHNKEN
jgi:hypothetical protein